MRAKRRLVDVDGLVDYLDGALTASQARDRVYRRTIPHLHIGRNLRFDLDDIDEWLDAAKVQAVA